MGMRRLVGFATANTSTWLFRIQLSMHSHCAPVEIPIASPTKDVDFTHPVPTGVSLAQWEAQLLTLKSSGDAANSGFISCITSANT
jgi:hypothetical protein